jgi:Histidine-specific methyltransferase, SAM-dependent
MECGKEDVPGPLVPESGKVLDIGRGRLSDTLKIMLTNTFLAPEIAHCRLLPPALLSNEAGLRLWKELTRLPDYYQTREEISLLEKHGRDIASHIPEGSGLRVSARGVQTANLETTSPAGKELTSPSSFTS